jgi:tRNA nucleotidyltransferase (CCA-adding enzyme)
MKYDWELPMFMIRSLKRNAAQLQNISAERIRDELDKTLVTGSPDRAIKLLRITGLLNYIIPEFKSAYKMTQNVHHNRDVFGHTLDVLKGTNPVLLQRLMALFHDIGKTATRSVTPTGVHFYGHEDVGADMTRNIMRRLKYPTELIDAVVAGVSNHMKLKHGGDDAVKLSDKTLRKFKIALGDKLEDVLNVIHADNTAHSEASSMPNQIVNVRRRLKDLEASTPSEPKLPITGKDLIDMGVKPGPIFSKILSAITEKWYENPNITTQQALHIAKSIINSQPK